MCRKWRIFMYYIGIDVSKYKHDCFIMNEHVVVIRDSFSFDNNKEGFKLFLDVVKSLDCSQEIKIGLEATGHYGDNLKLILSANNLSFMEINPTLVKRYIRGLSFRKQKTDKSDARWIAKYIANPDNPFKSYQIELYHLRALKSLTRSRESLVKHRSQYLVMITNTLDKIFPEYKDFWDNKLSNTALFILKKYKKPSRIAKFTRDDCVKCHNHARVIPVSRFEDLAMLAKHSVGYEEPFLLEQLQIFIDLYEIIDQRISKIESKIDSIVVQIDSPIFSIKGIGVYSAAAIIGEFGDINKYKSANQLLAFAGLDCSRDQSGQKDTYGKTVKTGSPHLRYNLLNIVRPLCLHNPVFKAYYHKKRVLEHKPRRVAEIHVVKKLLRVIFALYTNTDEDGNLVKFDSEKLR